MRSYCFKLRKPEIRRQGNNLLMMICAIRGLIYAFTHNTDKRELYL
jgi:hypothetical protein